MYAKECSKTSNGKQTKKQKGRSVFAKMVWSLSGHKTTDRPIILLVSFGCICPIFLFAKKKENKKGGQHVRAHYILTSKRKWITNASVIHPGLRVLNLYSSVLTNTLRGPIDEFVWLDGLSSCHYLLLVCCDKGFLHHAVTEAAARSLLSHPLHFCLTTPLTALPSPVSLRRQYLVITNLIIYIRFTEPKTWILPQWVIRLQYYTATLPSPQRLNFGAP